MVHSAALDPHLVEARHVAVHGLPLSAASERRRRRVRDCVEHSVDLGGDLRG